MAARPGTTGPVLVGRSAELATFRALVDSATAGESGALLVSGDPGVGKTALVQQAWAHLESDAIVLSGAAMPLTTLSVPFLALRSALRNHPGNEGRSFFQPGQPLVDVPILFDDWYCLRGIDPARTGDSRSPRGGPCLRRDRARTGDQ